MSLKKQVYQCLFDIERAMHELSLWQTTPPPIEAFESTEPFNIDTMSAEQWLQWVMLPRMFALLESGASLPRRIAITPYFEEALKEQEQEIKPLLRCLLRLDTLLNQPN